MRSTQLPLCSTSRMEAITFLKQLQRLLYVVWLLIESLRIPLAARHTEEVAAIDMNRPGQPPDRIGDRMDDVVAQEKGVALAKALAPAASIRFLASPGNRRHRMLSSRPE